MVSGRKMDENEEGLLDCRTAHHNAVTSHADYTPKCSFDGNYEQIQCYKVVYILVHGWSIWLVIWEICGYFILDY